MIKKFSGKGRYFILTYILLFIGIISSPFWFWALKPEKPLKVLIVDKTVPNTRYNEHKGLMWVLNNEKYVKSNGKPYVLQQDYVGFKPKENHEYKINELPKKLTNYDVVYLADQYGVDKEDFFGEIKHDGRVKSLYGGLKVKEVERLEETLLKRKGKTLIAEYNTFASPTEENARMKISNLLNLDWSGWIGRYFSNLADPEVPIWVKEKYVGNWNFKGAGIVLVNKDDFVVVVGDKDVTKEGVPIRLTKRGEAFFQKNLNSLYQNWFDIVEPRNDDEVLANFHLPVGKKGKQHLKEMGIPTSFPAVTHFQNVQYTSYYFSGNFANEDEVPNIYQTSGISLLKKHISERESFYWKTYVPMMKRILAQGLHHEIKQQSVELLKKDNMTINSQTGNRFLQIRKKGKWEDFLIKGVNMGIAKPGHFPGETAITKDEYLRWFKAIGDMNANAIRVYTLHPPGFYQALYEYNQIAKTPLYLFHGTWVSEESLLKSQNAFSTEVIADFQLEIRHMIDIIHGKALIPKRPGHAAGKYSADVSRYILGFILGIEWDPEVVYHTNIKNKNLAQWDGKYFKTTGASPFEVWLAQMMDYAAAYEADQYKWQHSMSFSNWVTTDLLNHPAEPSKKEDLVSVNPNHIVKTEEFHSGLFASYHIYPYYPDFLNYEKKYLDYKDATGKPNNYAGYLNDLMKVHKMPVVVAEFGVPASRGMTHTNPYGMNQGFHSEVEQGEINQRLFHSIVDEGFAGGLVFTWQDEWFKRTWNTMDLDDPNRRPYWSNVQTNEQHFGLMSFEPSKREKQMYVDGLQDDWKKLKQNPVYQAENQNEFIQQLDMHADQSYLYFKLSFGQPIDWKEADLFLLLDTIPNQGQKTINWTDESRITTKLGTDFLVQIMNESSSRVMVDSYYDPFYYQYGELLKIIKQVPYASQQNNGVFHPIRYALNKQLVIPSTKETLPFQAYETGNLLFGNGNPDHKNFNSLTDISISKDKRVLEMRLPWLLLNVKDPSTKNVIGDLWKHGLYSSEKIEEIKVMILPIQQGEIQYPFHQNHFFSFKWKSWEQPLYEERLKKSYFIMKDLYGSIGIKGEED